MELTSAVTIEKIYHPEQKLEDTNTLTYLIARPLILAYPDDIKNDEIVQLNIHVFLKDGSHHYFPFV